MARKKKQTDIEDAIADTKPARTNGFDPGKVQGYVERIESLHADIATEMATALNACRQIHGDIKQVYQEAKDEAGVPKKALKKVVKARGLERKAAECRADLEGDDLDSYDLIRHALGDLADTPLGAAATDRAGFKDALQQTIAAGDALANGSAPVPTSGPGTPTDPAVMEQLGRGPA